ncbi:MAG: hypothetical protein V4695_08905 [Pseudomonadota bacterium]
MPRIFCCITQPVVLEDNTYGAVAPNEAVNFPTQAPANRPPATLANRAVPHALRSIARGQRSQQSISDANFNAMDLAGKIRWLRRSAPPLPEGSDPGTNNIEVGPRVMTRRNVLCLALDYAIQGKKEEVPAICRQLITEYQAQDMNFLVLGIPFSRNRLCDWAREGLAVETHVAAAPEVQDMGKQLYNDNNQNVHAASVVIAMAAQLTTIRNRIPTSKNLSHAAAEAEIKSYLNTLGHGRAALKGLQIVSQRPEEITNFGESVQGCLTVLWNYIRAVEDPEMRLHLKESMAAKLGEIHREQPCATGMIERLIDIPTAIDWSITQKITLQHLRNELQTMAGAINESCDADDDMRTQAEIAVAEAQSDASKGQVEACLDRETTKLKRDRFLHTARIELGLLRGIDQQLITAEAERIFPENMIL